MRGVLWVLPCWQWAVRREQRAVVGHSMFSVLSMARWAMGGELWLVGGAPSL